MTAGLLSSNRLALVGSYFAKLYQNVGNILLTCRNNLLNFFDFLSNCFRYIFFVSGIRRKRKINKSTYR